MRQNLNLNHRNATPQGTSYWFRLTTAILNKGSNVFTIAVAAFIVYNFLVRVYGFFSFDYFQIIKFKRHNCGPHKHVCPPNRSGLASEGTIYVRKIFLRSKFNWVFLFHVVKWYYSDSITSDVKGFVLLIVRTVRKYTVQLGNSIALSEVIDFNRLELTLP